MCFCWILTCQRTLCLRSLSVSGWFVFILRNFLTALTPRAGIVLVTVSTSLVYASPPLDTWYWYNHERTEKLSLCVAPCTPLPRCGPTCCRARPSGPAWWSPPPRPWPGWAHWSPPSGPSHPAAHSKLMQIVKRFNRCRQPWALLQRTCSGSSSCCRWSILTRIWPWWLSRN